MRATEPRSRDLLTQQELADWLGFQPNQAARIREALEERGIHYTLGRGGRVCTTIQAVNRAILGGSQEIEFR